MTNESTGPEESRNYQQSDNEEGSEKEARKEERDLELRGSNERG